MNFDFSKFATMTANTVESAFTNKPQEVIADIAKEIKAEEVKQQPVVTETVVTETVAQEPVIQNFPVGNSTLTPEEIIRQAEYLKQQKAIAEQRESNINTLDNKDVVETVEAEIVEEKAPATKKTAKKKQTTSKPKTTEKAEEKPIVFSRPRRVVAYGDEIYTELDTTATLEDIRAKLVSVYGYSEFRESSRCTMVFDAKTGEVYPEIVFNKKG